MSPTFDFGKHKGKTVEWVHFHDPAYMTWLANTPDAVRKVPVDTMRRMYAVLPRAMSLRIPRLCFAHCGRNVSRMWLVKGMSGRLVKVVFACDECKLDGGLPAVSHPPSFFHSEVFRDYDKTGAQVLVGAIQRAYFGSTVQRMSQKRMEAFFDDSRNFHV